MNMLLVYITVSCMNRPDSAYRSSTEHERRWIPAGWDSGPGRGCVGQAARQRYSPQTRCRWHWNSACSPSGSLVLCSTASPPPGSCDATRPAPPLLPGQSHKSVQNLGLFTHLIGWWVKSEVRVYWQYGEDVFPINQAIKPKLDWWGSFTF